MEDTKTAAASETELQLLLNRMGNQLTTLRMIGNRIDSMCERVFGGGISDKPDAPQQVRMGTIGALAQVEEEMAEVANLIENALTELEKRI